MGLPSSRALQQAEGEKERGTQNDGVTVSNVSRNEEGKDRRGDRQALDGPNGWGGEGGSRKGTR